MSSTFSSAAMCLLVQRAPVFRGRSTQSLVLCEMAPQLRPARQARERGGRDRPARSGCQEAWRPGAHFSHAPLRYFLAWNTLTPRS